MNDPLALQSVATSCLAIHKAKERSHHNHNANRTVHLLGLPSGIPKKPSNYSSMTKCQEATSQRRSTRLPTTQIVSIST